MKLVTSEIMKKLDKDAMRLHGIKGITLMENAGRGAAGVIHGLFPREKYGSAAIIAGKGNNGGDGFVTARYLKNFGYDVTVFAFREPSSLKGDAGINAKKWIEMGGSIEKITKRTAIAIKDFSLIVDAIFGTGLNVELSGIYRDVIDGINRLKKPVVSIDMPSGVCATTGKILGCAVRADITCALALRKLGLYLYPGRSHAGKVETIDIGIPKKLIDGEKIRFNLIDDCVVRKLLRPREKDSHKGSYGHTLIIGGSPGKTGAAYMAGMGAMRVGSGLATIALPESLNAIMEVKTTEIMTYPLPEKDGLLGGVSYNETEKILKGKSSLVIGPGLGTGDLSEFMARVIKKCRREKIPIVIDADGLNVLNGNIKALKDSTGIVLTPHPGEMTRLLGVTTKDIQRDRINSARRLAKETGCVVVLKGASTIVADRDETFINPTGNPGMATAGTGDVLSGMIGGFISQGLRAMDAAIAAVYLHGLTGDKIAERQGEIGMIATDLLDTMPEVLNSFACENRRVE